MASMGRNRLVLCVSAVSVIIWSLTAMHAISTAQTSDQSLAELVGLIDPTGGFDNASGTLRTVSLDRVIDTNTPFFQDLGTNRRACVACREAISMGEREAR